MPFSAEFAGVLFDPPRVQSDPAEVKMRGRILESLTAPNLTGS